MIIATISVKFFRNYLGAHYFDQKVQSNNFKGRSPDTVYRKETIKRVPRGVAPSPY